MEVDQWLSSCFFTSIGVDTFFSLITSYFCFFVPAFSPCHGKMIAKTKQKNRTELLPTPRWVLTLPYRAVPVRFHSHRIVEEFSSMIQVNNIHCSPDNELSITHCNKTKSSTKTQIKQREWMILKDAGSCECVAWELAFVPICESCSSEEHAFYKRSSLQFRQRHIWEEGKRSGSVTRMPSTAKPETELFITTIEFPGGESGGEREAARDRDWWRRDIEEQCDKRRRDEDHWWRIRRDFDRIDDEQTDQTSSSFRDFDRIEREESMTSKRRTKERERRHFFPFV